MARPKTYADGARIHVGIRYDRRFVALFDRLAKKQGISRNQAVDFCLRDAVKNGKIPPYAEEVDAMIEAEAARTPRRRPELLNVDGDGKARNNERIKTKQAASS